MTVVTPPRRPETDHDTDLERRVDALEALIEEARRRARRRRRRLAGGAVLLLAGLAVYLGIAHRGGSEDAQALSASRSASLHRLARNGPLTILTATGSDGIATVETVGRGRAKILWRCPGGYWCGEPVSSAWAPDGKRLAVTLDEITLDYPYPLALHVINLKSGRDVRIRRLGCWPATELAWSPGGTRLAYRCGSLAPGRDDPIPDDHINVLDLDAPSYRRPRVRPLATHGRAFWPSWSPDGKRIAYSTTHGLAGHARIYTIDLDGSHRRLLAVDAAAPAWSPDGTRLAYESRCGLRLVTPEGRDVTPGSGVRCRAIGPRGLPGWSPDGTKIAIETNKGIYVVNADGSQLRRLTGKTSSILELGEAGHLERPSWLPD